MKIYVALLLCASDGHQSYISCLFWHTRFFHRVYTNTNDDSIVSIRSFKQTNWISFHFLCGYFQFRIDQLNPPSRWFTSTGHCVCTHSYTMLKLVLCSTNNLVTWQKNLQPHHTISKSYPVNRDVWKSFRVIL